MYLGGHKLRYRLSEGAESDTEFKINSEPPYWALRPCWWNRLDLPSTARAVRAVDGKSNLFVTMTW